MTLTHLDSDGKVRMVDVSGKRETEREAMACGKVTMSPGKFTTVKEGYGPKGDAFTVAKECEPAVANDTHTSETPENLLPGGPHADPISLASRLIARRPARRPRAGPTCADSARDVPSVLFPRYGLRSTSRFTGYFGRSPRRTLRTSSAAPVAIPIIPSSVTPAMCGVSRMFRLLASG